MLAKSAVNPTVGLFSKTFATKNAVLDKAISSGVKDIVQGRKPMTTLDDLVRTWRNTGGDAMRKEYEAQLQSR
ncbi:hypothetical protein ACWF0M_31760 [Kribbella sp. NPDC055110]